MNQTQLKLKEYFDELLNETSHTARYGDHSSHSGYFNSESGYGEPPYTGDGLAAEEELTEWEEFMKDPLAMFDWEYSENMPELAQKAYEKWLEIYRLPYPISRHIENILQIALVEKFARDFYQVVTGHDFEVVQI